MAEPLARRAGADYLAPMTTRPCKPDADLKRIWQTLLPGMPFPACGTADDADAAASDRVQPATESRDDATPKRVSS
jgi:hypothetical protein